MKLLLVTTSYPADGDDPSGHFVRTEARALARQGHEVHVVAPLGSPFDPPEHDPREPSLHVHRVGGGSLFGWPGIATRARTNPVRLLHALPFGVAARARIEALGPVDRAIAHWMIPSGFPLLFAHPAPLEVVAHGADVRLLCALPTALRLVVIEVFLRRRTNFRFVAEVLRDALCSALPTHVAARLEAASRIEPAAIELPDVTARARMFRASIDADARGFVVAVGRLVELKRFDLVLEAAADARVPIVIVGDGPLRSDLERLAHARGARTTFPGLVSRHEALGWIAAASVLVHASAAEAAPTVVREARALGVPVVASAAGDLAAWARHDPGIMLVAPSRNALAAGIEAVLGARKNTDRPDQTHKFRE